MKTRVFYRTRQVSLELARFLQWGRRKEWRMAERCRHSFLELSGGWVGHSGHIAPALEDFCVLSGGVFWPARNSWPARGLRRAAEDKLDSRRQLVLELSAAARRWAFDSWEKLKDAADKMPVRIVRNCPVKGEQQRPLRSVAG